MSYGTLAQTYDRIANDWSLAHQDDDWWKDGFEKFATLVRAKHGSNASVMDAGCGPGLKSKILTNQGFDVLGIDISRSMIKLAQENNPHQVRSKFEHVDFSSRFFPYGPCWSGVFAEASLLHVSHDFIGRAVRNLAGSLAKDGYFYASVKAPHKNGPNEELKREDDLGYTYERFFAYYTLEHMRDYMAKENLSVVYENIVQSGSTEWIQIIAQK